MTWIVQMSHEGDCQIWSPVQSPDTGILSGSFGSPTTDGFGNEVAVGIVSHYLRNEGVAYGTPTFSERARDNYQR